jgi:hypothetical protein
LKALSICRAIGFGGVTHAAKKWLFRDTRQIVSFGSIKRKLTKNLKGRKDISFNRGHSQNATAHQVDDSKGHAGSSAH